MKTVVINGKEIKTNLGGTYYKGNRNGTKNGVYKFRNRVAVEGQKYGRYETEEEMLIRLSENGYRRITFYYSSSGCEIYALCYR